VADKRERQSAIRDIVAGRDVASQEELRRLLSKRGWDVTQSTLSRDLHELRLARVPDGSGKPRYAFSDPGLEEPVPQLQALLPQLLTGVQSVQVMVVVRTMSSGAQPVAAALDSAAWPDVLGTIAGDDTVLIVCRSTQGRDRVVKRLRAYLRNVG
jgi:transcriptional regulator of arginine metabolism